MAQSAGRHSGEVTITAERAEILQGIDDLVFTVTREFATGDALGVPVTLSRGILPFSRLSHTVTIPANKTSATLTVSTFQRLPGAVTGDITATVADGPDHDVGDPSTSSTHVHVGRGLVTLSFSGSSMRVGEGVGSSRDEVRLIARTSPNVPPPRDGFSVSVFTGERTAKREVDYRGFSRTFPIYGEPRGNWVADGDTYVSSTQVTVWPIDDDLDEGDEHFAVQVQTLPNHPPAVRLVPPDPSAPPCARSFCVSNVVIVDDDTGEPGDADEPEDTEKPGDTNGPQGTEGPEDTEKPGDTNGPQGTEGPEDTEEPGQIEEPGDAEEPDAVVVTLVHVPGDGTTFAEDDQVFFRLLFSAADGGPAPGGVDVELSFEWTHFSPIVPTSAQVTRIGLSLHRVDVWDSAVQILDNDVGNPDSTVTIRITGCWRSSCVIGEPSEITVTIADDDGGPEAAPPGPPDPPRLVCAASGDGYDSTGIAVSWQAPSFVGGAPINGYDVQYQRRISGGDQWVWGDWQAWSHSGTTTSTTIIGLDADSFYAVRVRAVNTNGPSQWSLASTFGTGEPDHICEILDQLTP